MKRVGIITMYHGSYNYGGVLQSYALQKVVSDLGYYCEQISFQRKEKKSFKSNIKNRLEVDNLLTVIVWGISRTKKVIDSKIARKIYGKKYNKFIKIRKGKFDEYRNSIPHSEIYNSETIKESLTDYDAFICGSDQVWKPGVVCKEYLLNFVPNEISKISYAASISKNKLSAQESELIISGINRLDAVSVREKQAVNLINKYTEKKVEWVLDPTFLVHSSHWETQCEEVKIKEDYIFCYLLGVNKSQRKLIENLARKNNLKIVTIPFANGNYNFTDASFGDIKVCDAGPHDFLGLIKNAKLVITDSFHATVFSNIFNTDFYVFERTEETSMNSRIISLLEFLNLKDRFIQCFDKDIIWESIDFRNRRSVDKKIEECKEFLERSLNGKYN